MDSSDTSAGTAAMTIGAVEQATGIPANTLRTWERRYGFPSPMRTDGGHRLYAEDSVERIRWIARALSQGFRPGQVVPLDLDTLKHTLSLCTTTPPERTDDPEPYVRAWIEASRRLDGEALERSFRTEAAHLGALEFLVGRVAPFLVDLGDAWERGDLAVFHEHFVTARLQAFLGGLWHPLSDRNQGPLAVATTPSGELHQLGLEMAITALALAGWRVVSLGPNTPAADIGAAARHAGARAVILSISVHQRPARAREALGRIAGEVEGAAIVVGGGGAPEDVAGTLWLPDLDALVDWARSAA